MPIHGSPCETAERFLRTLFADLDPEKHRIALSWPPPWKPRLYRPDDEGLRLAAKAAVQRGTTKNAYVRTTAMRADFNAGTDERGEVDDASALVALWVDIDVEHEVHDERKQFPPNRETALEIVRLTIPLEPTIIVDSGHGLHLWWALPEPWVFESKDDHDEAGAVVEGFQAHLRTAFAAKGWALDSTFDLARVLRVPGTLNHKEVT